MGLLAVNCTCIVSSDPDLQLILLEEFYRAEERHRTCMSSGKRVREKKGSGGYVCVNTFTCLLAANIFVP